MDLFDFFYPEQAQAKYLRNISLSFRTGTISSLYNKRQDSELGAMKEDIRFLSMVLATILKRLSETKTMSLADVQDLIGDVDKLDGVEDRGLDPGVLRGLLGVLKQAREEEKDAAKLPSIISEPYYTRYRS